MEHILVIGHGYIGKVHGAVSPLPAQYLVRHVPKENEVFFTDFESAVKIGRFLRTSVPPIIPMTTFAVVHWLKDCPYTAKSR